jgi:hypothetical protein
MVAHVTAAVRVRGEHRGEVVHREWSFTPEACRANVCRRLRLTRTRAAGRRSTLTLRRTGRGRYAGRGLFYVALRCLGRTYPRGSAVPYSITVTVTRTTAVQGVRFARRIRATYTNLARSDDTPCPLGPSHDAARYSGRAGSPAPSPPVAAFTAAVDSSTSVAAFTDTSAPGGDGAAIVAWSWNFDDPASGPFDTSTEQDPEHLFSAPGAYTVSLTVTDADGLQAAISELVTVPASSGLLGQASTPGASTAPSRSRRRDAVPTTPPGGSPRRRTAAARLR